MWIVTKAGDWSFKAFTAGLGLATIYLTATFSVNVYHGLSWHNAQSVAEIVVVLSWLTFHSPYAVSWKLEIEQSEEQPE